MFSASLANLNAGARTASIPEQIVDRDGTISIPYAGQLKVVGLRPSDVETRIVDLLKNKAIEPQAVVTISKNFSNSVTVTGEVTRGAIIPLTVKGDRVLDVIASAGGISGTAAHETFVRLTRGGKTADIPFNAILASPGENVYVRPKDIITVVRDPQTFTAFGSTGQNASIPFSAVGISLEEAIAKAGGLLDSRADPAGIFLFRFEPAELVAQLQPGRQLPSEGDLVPVIYRLNLRNANSFFLARAFQIKNKDILYVSNAPSTPVEKFLRLVGAVTAPVVSGVNTGVRLAN
ncbi:MAG: polysaccharide biosynthesis/export family protein [Pseudolabrys sp.]